MEPNKLIVKVQLDGYTVGDRLLEGVMFNYEIEVISYEECKVLSIEVDNSAKLYFEDLNQQKWLEVMKDYVEDDPRNAWEYLSDEEYNILIEQFPPLM